MTGNNFKTLLNTDEAVAQTILGVADTTGWRVGDEICIASTTQTASQCEKRTILTVDSSTQVTVTSGLTNAHSGTSPTQAEVGNLTKNVKIRGIGTNAPSTTTTLQSYINIAAQAVVTLRYCQFSYLGSATSLKRGIDVATTTGTFDMQYCSISDGWITSSRGLSITSTSGSGITVSNNVTFNLNSQHLANSGTTGIQTISNNLCMLNVAITPIFELGDAGSTYTNNVATGSANAGFGMTGSGELIGTFSNNTGHSNAQPAFQVTSWSGIMSGNVAWRNAGNGGTILLNVHELTLINPIFFGNSIQNIGMIGTNYGTFNCLVSGMVSNGDTSFATANGVRFTSGGGGNIIFEDCDFSTVSGIKTAHTNDVAVVTANTSVQLTFLNCKLGAATQVSGQTNLTPNGFVSAQRLGTTAGIHKSWFVGGTLTIDTTIFNTAAPSARLTPLSASVKMVSATKGRGFKKKVANGNTVTASVYVRKSDTGAGDATTYNGNFPRLIVRKNVAAGISADTVLATATSASAGAWELLSGTTSSVTDDCVLEFYCDCDGTVGFVSLDDFS